MLDRGGEQARVHEGLPGKQRNESALQVYNFKALRCVEVPLRPFTVLIGPNDSGKSLILQALDVLGCFEEEEFWSSLAPDPARVVYQGEQNRLIFFEVRGKLDSSETFYSKLRFRVDKDRRGVARDSMFFQGGRHATELGAPRAKRALSSAMIRFRPEALARPCELRNIDEGMDADGHGLAAILDALITGPDRRALFELEEQLHKLVPTIRGVSLVTIDIDTPQGRRAGKALELVLTQQRDGHDVTIPAAHTSQGTLLALGYLALVYSRTATCLLIEEPENGLHPSALGFIVDLLKKVSRGEVGPGPRQVVLTTHSPLLLNFVEPEDVLIVTRTEDNVRVTPMVETPHFAERFEDFDLGELWYDVGEDDLIKEP